MNSGDSAGGGSDFHIFIYLFIYLFLHFICFALSVSIAVHRLQAVNSPAE